MEKYRCRCRDKLKGQIVLCDLDISNDSSLLLFSSETKMPMMVSMVRSHDASFNARIYSFSLSIVAKAFPAVSLILFPDTFRNSRFATVSPSSTEKSVSVLGLRDLKIGARSVMSQ